MSKISVLEPLVKQRLFAVIHLFGKQHIITSGDLLTTDNHIPLECGKTLLINKCLILGGRDFSIIGRPIIDKELFKIEATVVEQTMTDHRCQYRSKPRNRGLKKYFFQSLPRTTLRINDIELYKLPEDD